MTTLRYTEQHTALDILTLFQINSTIYTTSEMQTLKQELQHTLEKGDSEIEDFLKYTDALIPQQPISTDAANEAFKYQVITQTLEEGILPIALFEQLQERKLIDNHRFTLAPTLFEIEPQVSEDKKTVKVRNTSYRSFCIRLHQINRYVVELQSALAHLEQIGICNEKAKNLSPLFTALNISKDTSTPILQRFQEIFDKYCGLQGGLLKNALKTQEILKTTLLHIKSHPLQRGKNHITTVNSPLSTSLAAAVAKGLRYFIPPSSSSELDTLAPHEAYAKELECIAQKRLSAATTVPKPVPQPPPASDKKK
ncbi:MAG: hypothetical protein FJZ63_03540 [Chlamydiae bacterium]|nr:hypothetical protein [Chlamydiota bacterium]